MAIRLLLADDHAIFRQALRTVLDKERDLAVVGEAGDGATALRLAKEQQPDVVLLDISLPDINGIEIAARMHQAHAGVRILALSSHTDQRLIREMLDAGALGYVMKSCGSQELLRGIRAAAQGDTYLCPDTSAALLGAVRRAASAPDHPALGRRELDVLRLVAEGRTSPEIAQHLNIALGTVEVHRRNIMRKLDLHSVAELTKYAIREGIVQA